MNIAIILAGGVGTRMGIKDTPKQFIDIYGKPILVHTLEKFDNNINIDKICIVSLKNYIEDIQILIRRFEIKKVEWVIEGGRTRQISVSNAIRKLNEICKCNDIILIHDAVRPLISSRIINENISVAKEFGAVDTVIVSDDTIVKSLHGKDIHSIPKRQELYLGQTPQTFKFDLIKAAHKNAEMNKFEDATDDCQLVLNLDEKVKLVKGDKLNFKITSFEDLTLLKALIKGGN